MFALTKDFLMQSERISVPEKGNVAERVAARPRLEYPAALPKKPLDPEVARLLNELREWCAQEYGRQAQVARILGVNRRRISDWFSGRILPSLATGLKIQNFLRTQK